MILHEGDARQSDPRSPDKSRDATLLILPRKTVSRYNLRRLAGVSSQREPAGEIPNEVRENSMANSSAERKHAPLVACAVEWLRRKYGCGIVLSEQYCAGGEVPDVIGWKGFCQSVLVECKVSRSDFLADANKPFRLRPEEGLGSRRFYMAPAGVIAREELPPSWGLLECTGREVRLAVKPGRQDLRTTAGLMKEMNLLLASLRRVEVRIEPQTITDFLKWKNRMAEYNGGRLPEGMAPRELERNIYLA